MISHASRLKSSIVFVAITLCVLSIPSFSQISFNNFSDVSSLALNGSTTTANDNGSQALRLTTDGTFHVAGTAWFKTQQQSVDKGFTTAFQFRILHQNAGADGLAFVIQNSVGDGLGTGALGGSGGAIGYGVPDPGDINSPIPNSLAVEFDTYQNGWDPNNNHIAVQSCGPDPNTQDHTALCPSGNPANLGIVSDLGGIQLADGNLHTAVVDYDPGTLRVFVDDFGTPLLTVQVTLDQLLNLNEGNAWVGFTGSVGGSTETHDILTWTFTPGSDDTTIQQTLTPGQQNAVTNYVFGSYNHKLQYSNANGGDNVAVTAIPIDQQTFHDTRLSGTPFTNAQCVIYDGTGGLCVEFEVNCSQNQGSDCTDLNYDVFNSFNTSQQINGACVLKAPIGTNNWQNIIETFVQTRYDPGTHGGSKGFSDFIVLQNCTALPSVNITSPANGSTVLVNQNVTINFTCGTDPNAPLVTITSCTGSLDGNPVTNGQVVVFTQTGSHTLIVTALDSVQDTNTGTSVFTVGQVPAFTSPNYATFQVGVAGMFTVSTTGFPPATITTSGPLPAGLSLVNNGDGTATLSGTPLANTGGVYNPTFTATNSAGNAMQPFTLTVLQAPVITSPNNAGFQVGTFGSFTVTTTGYPVPSLSESGTLPNGVSFVDNGNGTGTLSGKPTNAGTFNITFTAMNTAGTATQNFTLTVSGGPQISITPSSINFGTVRLFNIVWQNVTVKNTGSTSLQMGKVWITLGKGADWDDYFDLDLCPNTLSPGRSCLITVFFNADDLGASSATLNISDNAPGSPQQVPLSANVVKH